MQRKKTIWFLVVLVITSIAIFLARGRNELHGNPQRTALPSPKPEAKSAPVVLEPIARPLPLVAASVQLEQAPRIEGKVVTRGTERGIAGAEITFEHVGKAFSIRTSSEGLFSFQPKELGMFSLAAITATGHLPFAPAWGSSPIALNIGSGTAIRDLRFSLNPAVEYTARVLDPNGLPVPNAAVRIWADPEQALFPIAENFITDARGECRFSASEGTIVQATHPSYAYARASIDLQAQITRRVVLELRPHSNRERKPTEISGFVLDEQELPVIGAKVTAVFGGGPFADPRLHPSGITETDSSGAFRITELDRGAYQVTASAEGYAPTVVAPVNSGTADIRLHLTRGSRIRGQVRDAETLQPIASFTVAVFHRWGPMRRAFASVKSVIDATGLFELDPLTPGSLVLVAGARGHSTAEAEVELRADSDARADFLLEKAGTVWGSVTDQVSHQPIPNAQVKLESGNAVSSFLISSNTDSSGQFELRDVPLGLRSIEALAEDHHARIVSGLEVVNTKPVGPVRIELAPLGDDEEPKIEFVGIGATMSVQEDVLILGGVVNGGGAAEVGLSRGDAILEIDGVAVPSLGFEGSINKIRGPENSEVLLKIRRRGDGSIATVRVPRRRIRG